MVDKAVWNSCWTFTPLIVLTFMVSCAAKRPERNKSNYSTSINYYHVLQIPIEGFCAQVIQNWQKKTFGLSFLRSFTRTALYILYVGIFNGWPPIGTLLFSSDRRLMQNIKTSVEDFNILQTDVSIFCRTRRFEENKTVQVRRVGWTAIFHVYTRCFCTRATKMSQFVSPARRTPRFWLPGHPGNSKSPGHIEFYSNTVHGKSSLGTKH